MKTDLELISHFDRDGDHFLTIAHRGASAYYPENTMAAFRAAIDMKADMMELDVLLSKDGKVVVIHDATLDRTTNGTGLVAEKTWEELKKLDAGSWFDAEFSGENIPALKEALELAKGAIAVNIEIKTEAVSDKVKGGIEEKSLAIVKELGMENQVIFSSFSYRALQHLRKLDSDIPTAILFNNSVSSGPNPVQLVDSLQANAFNCSFRELTSQWMLNTREHQIPVLVYTVNQQSQMKNLIEQGVAGIFSDKPDLLKKTAQSLRL